MVCPKCGSENKEESLFCNNCGAELSQNNKKQGNQLINIIVKIKSFSNKKKSIIACSVLVIIICMVTGIIYFNNPISKFKSDIKNNKQAEAVKIYDDKIRGNFDRENNINIFLKDEITKIEKLFVNDEIDYVKVNSKLKIIKETGLVSSEVNNSITKTNNLNNSRIAFEKGEEFIKNKDFINAIKEYKSVISDDKNYESAKVQIKNNEKQYKNQVLKSVENFANNKEYEKVVGVLSEAITILPNDTDLTAKTSVYEKLEATKVEAERKQKMEGFIRKQEVDVLSCNVVSDYFNLNDEAKVIVKNKTNKVIKKYSVGILMYDSNGYPLESGTLAGENQLFQGKVDSANIQPGQSFGEDYVWNLYTDYGTINKIIACVIEVEYYDGSKWTNDYYDYWKEEHLGKQLK
ncbi:zinc-ribbon domain-containing protein [Clostridium frigoris]|uniref:Zinc-ribbon domain-containing protein n=1 Tax=Clostridium frigoris TaxID=205327 RepID=A0ABS6BU84_9CLOT|nr:DUF5780 domain-containing protein [Clostridium frigoris]MBU3160472.1 zinc-ribbon domain-containing protein [Clostridium frigoris]